MHDVFHICNLKKCLSDEILGKRKIKIVNVKWNAKRGPEFTWKPEAEIRRKYHNSSSTKRNSGTEFN
jgi:hypothetical protein